MAICFGQNIGNEQDINNTDNPDGTFTTVSEINSFNRNPRIQRTPDKTKKSPPLSWDMKVQPNKSKQEKSENEKQLIQQILNKDMLKSRSRSHSLNKNQQINDASNIKPTTSNKVLKDNSSTEKQANN